MTEEFSYSYGNYFASDRFVRMRFDIVKDMLAGLMKEESTILDIGCYDGAMYEVLKSINAGLDYLGVDTDKTALAIAQKRGAKVMDINFESAGLPFMAGSYDIVILGEVLEHLRNPENLLKKAKEILKPQGVILISLPNECTLYHRLKCFLGKGIDGTGFASGYHLHFPTLQQDREFVGKYFNVIKEKYWYHLGVGGLGEKILNSVPGPIIKFLVQTWPALFARGVIYLCQKTS